MKKPRLRNRNVIPHGGGFRITDPLTGIEFFGLQFDNVYQKICDSRKANGIPYGIEFEEEVEQWCCLHYPDECDETDPDMPTVRKLALSDVIHGTQVMVAFKLAGSPLVDRAEAERRGQICVKCPFNQKFAKPCSGVCAELQSLVSSIVGQQGTQYDQSLNACSICGCFLQAAIWLPLEIQCKGVPEAMRKKFANVQTGCWKTCENL